MFGCGAVAQLVLSNGSHGLFLTVNLAFGFAATLGILVCGQVSGNHQFYLKLHCAYLKHYLPCFYNVIIPYVGWFITRTDIWSLSHFSGGHLNPAVTFALCVLGREPWKKFPMYFLFQTIGSFFGAAVIYAMYYGEGWVQFNSNLENVLLQPHMNRFMFHKDQLRHINNHRKCFTLCFVFHIPLDALCEYTGGFDINGPNSTAGIFATYPGTHLSLINGFFDQVIFVKCRNTCNAQH